MFSKFTSFFKKQNPEGQSKFDHSKLTDAGPSQCPFMKNKSKKSNEAQEKNGTGCPYKNNNGKSQQQNKNQATSDSQEEQKPRGGCPFMGTSAKKRNPGLGIEHEAYDEPFVSKYKYYLSANKLDFSIVSKGKSKVNRQIFNKYPIYLQHTLFFNGEDFQKVRKLECCSRFLAYQELREKGNKYFNKGKFSKALDYYERAMSLFRWLQYKEPQKSMISQEKSEISSSEIQSMQSIESDVSKIHLNLQSNEEAISKNSSFEAKNQEIDQMREKYKEFFVVYHDENVFYFNGEQLQEDAQIDMRKSLLIQVYLNMASAYMNLNHFTLAQQIINDSFELTEKVSQSYLRKAQSLILRKDCTLDQAQFAKKLVNHAIEMKPNEKIFKDANTNILKMLNLADVDQVYAKCLEKVNEKINEIRQTEGKWIQKVYNRAVQINEIEKQMIAQGKTPKESYNEQTLYDNSQYKILARMKQKYVRIIDFYTQAQKKQQVQLGKKQFQQVLKVLSQVELIYNLKIQQKNNEFGDINSNFNKISSRLARIKTRFASDIYNAGKYNFHVLEWAIKQIVKQQKEERQRIAKQKKKQNGENEDENQSSGQGSLLNSKGWGKTLVPLLFLLPIIFIAFNYYIV